ncbi:MAG: transcriptional regulator [Clostridia bacterium]|nr:transcriptional regulator [Clostridia bacterium]
MSSSNLTKNDRAWEQLFHKHNILNEIECRGRYEITAAMINRFREARLMTKFDNQVNLPKLFLENDLSILPITRGSYVIGKFLAYNNLDPINSQLRKVTIPGNIESIDFENITSESLAINCAYISGILSDFLEDDDLLPTINGRMSSESFSFNILNQSGSLTNLQVENSQIEIDAGFEGPRQFCLIEAKNYLSDDFLVRQLYYPLRLWNRKLTKPIRSVFLAYSNGIYNLYEYDFAEIESYNSIALVKQGRYTFESTEITLDDIVNVINCTSIIPEPDIPFPQADNFLRVINLCELLIQGSMTRDEITFNYAFTPRQTNYYTDAGRYLGLIEKSMIDREVTFSLSIEGQKIMQLSYRPRQLAFVRKIISHQIFNEALRHHLNQGYAPTKDTIIEIMETKTPYGERTLNRRASTVRSWISWILSLITSEI